MRRTRPAGCRRRWPGRSTAGRRPLPACGPARPERASPVARAPPVVGRGAAGRSGRCRPGAAGRASSGRDVTTVAGHTKPPRLGPSGPSRMGMSPVKSTAPTEYGGVVDVRRVQSGLAAVGPGPRRPGPDQAHAGAGRVEVDLPRRAVERVEVAGGEELRRRRGARPARPAPTRGPSPPTAPAGTGSRGLAARLRLAGPEDVAGPQGRPPWPPNTPRSERGAAARGSRGRRCRRRTRR